MLSKTVGVSVFTLAVVAALIAVSAPTTAQDTATKGPIARFTATSDNVSSAGDTVRIDLLGWSADADRNQFLAAWNMTAPAPGARGAGARGGRAGAAGASGRGGRGAAPEEGAGRGAPPDAAGGGTPPEAAGQGRGAPPDDAAAADAGGRGGRGGRGGGRGFPAAGAEPAPRTPEGSLLAALQAASTVGFIWTSESTGYSIRYAHRIPQPDGGERIILATDRRLGAWNDRWKPTGTASANEYDFTVLELRLNAKGEGEGKASLTGKVSVDAAANSIALESYDALPVVLKGVKRQAGK